MKMTKASFTKALKDIAGNLDKFICMERNSVIVGNIFVQKYNPNQFEITAHNDYDYYRDNGKSIRTIQLWVSSETCDCFYEFDSFQIHDISD